MTATEELLRLLDERGAKYRRHIATVNGSMSIMDKIVLLDDAEKAVAFFVECQNVAEPTLFVEARMTPTQAVLAMLGPDPDKLKPIEGFTRDDVYRASMLERDEIIARAFGLIRFLYHSLINTVDFYGFSDEVEQIESTLGARIAELGVDIS